MLVIFNTKCDIIRTNTCEIQYVIVSFLIIWIIHTYV